MEKSFNVSKFSKDFKETRDLFEQKDFAKTIGLEDEGLIPLLESGKKAPSKYVFNRFCALINKNPDEYWIFEQNTTNAYLMGKIKESDTKSAEDVFNKIKTFEYLFALENY